MLKLKIPSTGFNTIIDITDQLVELLRSNNARSGLVSAMVVGSTSGMTVMRFEPGAVADLLAALERAAPSEINYQHLETTGDPNGCAHVRSVLVGTNVCFPYVDGAMGMSETHRIVIIDFDFRSSDRTIYIQPLAGIDRGLI